MTEYINAFEELYNRLESIKCDIEVEVLVSTLLASFRNKNKSAYGHLVTVLQTESDELD